jgi:hypothetical protein
MVGYIDYSAPVKVESKDVLLRHIRLQENSQLLKEVEVKGHLSILHWYKECEQMKREHFICRKSNPATTNCW